MLHGFPGASGFDQHVHILQLQGLERVMDSFVPTPAPNPCVDKTHCSGEVGRNHRARAALLAGVFAQAPGNSSVTQAPPSG